MIIIPKVDDVIRYGEAETIPAAVTAVKAENGAVAGRWTRSGFTDDWEGVDPYGTPRPVNCGRDLLLQSGEVTVIAVRPGVMVADDCSWCVAHGYTPGQLLTDEGIPVSGEHGERPLAVEVSLPELPPNTTLLVGRKRGHRYTAVDGGGGAPRWVREGAMMPQSLGSVLGSEGTVTAYVRPPRRWSKIEGAPADLAKVIVNGERWTRPFGSDTMRWMDGIGGRATFSQLRARGEVVEDF